MLNDKSPSQEASEAWQDVKAWAVECDYIGTVYSAADVERARAADAQQLAYHEAMWKRIGDLFKSGGMYDPAFLVGMVEVDAQQIAWFQKRTAWYDQQIAALRAENAAFAEDDLVMREQIATLQVERKEAEAQLAALQAELDRRDAFLEREGFRRCDAAACNCKSWHRDRDDARLLVLQAEQAQWQQQEEGLVEEIDCLCQAIEGHRCGSLTNDGLWHYWTKAKKLLAALTAQQEAK